MPSPYRPPTKKSPKMSDFAGIRAERTFLEWREYIPICSDYPIPAQRFPYLGKLPLEKMEVGDSFFLSNNQLFELYQCDGSRARRKVYTATAKWSKKFENDGDGNYKPKFLIRPTRDEGIRVWRVA